MAAVFSEGDTVATAVVVRTAQVLEPNRLHRGNNNEERLDGVATIVLPAEESRQLLAEVCHLVEGDMMMDVLLPVVMAGVVGGVEGPLQGQADPHRVRSSLTGVL